MRVAANLADRYGNGELRTTNTQNLVIINIPNSRTGAVAQALEAAGLHVEGSNFWRGAVACPGPEVCKPALPHGQAYTRLAGGEAGERPPRFAHPLRLNANPDPPSRAPHPPH